jgi:peptide/nickel transport system substrate-binding protein
VRWPLVIGVVLVAAAAATGVALYLRLSGEERTVIGQPTEYVEGVAGTWQRVNPIFATANAVDQDLSALIFSGLLRLAPDGSVEPDLAEALPEISEDGRAYTFTLRSGLRWHDGEPITTDDVRFTIEAIADPDFQGDPMLAEAWEGISLETPDSRTMVFRLEQASAPFLARNTTIGILPRHLLAGLSARALYEAPFKRQPGRVGALPGAVARHAAGRAGGQRRISPRRPADRRPAGTVLSRLPLGPERHRTP